MKKETAKKQEKTSKRKLSPRKQRLVIELTNPKNKTIAEAAKKAGYSPASARSTAYVVAQSPEISEAVEARIKRALANNKVTVEEVIGSAVRQMRSSMDDILDESGGFDLAKARSTGAVDFLKKHKETRKTIYNPQTKQNETTVVVEVELHSNQDARKEVANYIGLEKSPQPPIKSFTDEDLARELFNRQIGRGWTVDETIEGIKLAYPNVDVGRLLEEKNG